MNDNQFIVPPDNMTAGNSVPPTPVAPVSSPSVSSQTSSGDTNSQPSGEPAGEPSGPNLVTWLTRAFNWVKGHKALTASIGGASVVVVLVATVLITKQPVSFFGYQLNPLLPQASVLPCDPELQECPPIGGGGTGTGTSIDIPNVLITIGDSNDSSPSLPTDCAVEQNGPGSNVGTNGAADCLKVMINNPKETYSKDFRVCFGLDEVAAQCTPWASEGGGSTPQIMSGGSFESAQVRVEYRDLLDGSTISNVEVGVQVFYQNNNDPCGASSGLNWAKAITGQNTSNWSYGDQQDDDPGCALMSLRATSTAQPPAPTITIEGNLPDGTVGQQTYQVLDIGGTALTPCTWSLVSITPPVTGATVAKWFPDTVPMPPGQSAVTGVSADDTRGYFRATPTAPGVYQVIAKVDCQNGQTATKTLPWNVVAQQVGAIDILGSFPNGTVGQSYSQNLTISGQAILPCTWSLVSISPAMASAAMSAATGLFTATPTTAGTYQVTVRVDCQNGQTATKTLPWTVGTSPTPTTLSIAGSFPDGRVGQSYSTYVNTVNAGGSNCTITLVRITPTMPGATIVRVDNVVGTSETSGMFSATPSVAGNYIVSVSAECPPLIGDGPTRQASKDFNWTVLAGTTPPPPPVGQISLSGSFPNGTVGQVFNTNIVTTGTANLPCTWSLVSVSPTITGATLVASTNKDVANQSSTGFRATPTKAGTYQITIKATCQNGQSATKTFTWVVVDKQTPPPPPQEANCTNPTNLPFLTAIYRSWSPARGDHLYTTNANEKPSGYRAEGIAGYVYTKQVAGTVPIYRSNQPTLGSHYYSTVDDAAEYGYTNEGILGYTFANGVTGSAPWYRMHKGGTTSDYVHTVSEEERSAIKELGYVDEGIVAHLCGTPQPTALQPIYRMWNAAENEHFYTTNPAERDTVIARGFISEGITGYMYGVRKQGTSQVYRSYHKQEKHHYFSLTESEATGWGYTVEGIVGYIWPTSQSNTIPLYRLFHPRTRDNLYTASTAEVASAVAAGYEDQGVLGYMFLNAQ